MTDRIDVVVVGGGAAGIAAGRALAARGRRVRIVEALPRPGGRAHTETLGGMPLDLGCGWMHSAERNPLARLAESQGADLVHGQGAWQQQFHNIRISAEDQQQAWAAYQRFGEALRRHPPASDRAADAISAQDEPWRPFLDSLSGFINGVELDQLSVADFLAYDEVASDNNWRIPSGYGAFIVRQARGIDMTLNTRVTAVTHEGGGVALTTDKGTIHARAAVVAVSSNVLARGLIRFEPAVDSHLHAAAGLPLGLDDKIFLSMADPEAVPAESHLLGRLDNAATGSYYMRPLGRPVIECFLGGRLARGLEDAGDLDATDFVIGELRGLLGADFARGLSLLHATHWAKEPTILGSYSHALPGRAQDRALLARPVSERLAFAGEACSIADYSTAHGAWESGLAAARHIDEHLR